jgi:hypothetical protein
VFEIDSLSLVGTAEKQQRVGAIGFDPHGRRIERQRFFRSSEGGGRSIDKKQPVRDST